jgi:hypothetical protein
MQNEFQANFSPHHIDEDLDDQDLGNGGLWNEVIVEVEEEDNVDEDDDDDEGPQFQEFDLEAAERSIRCGLHFILPRFGREAFGQFFYLKICQICIKKEQI